MPTPGKPILGGMSGEAEKKIRGREQQLEDMESRILGTQTERQKKNEDSANGRYRLTTDDKKY